MRSVRELVAAAAHDESVLRNLRVDPAGLARSLNLGPGNVSALLSAERFFDSEAPILDRPAGNPNPAPVVTASPGLFASAPRVVPAVLVATADTGTLLTGPTTGTYTISSSATATVTARPSPAPAVPAPVPVAPTPAVPAVCPAPIVAPLPAITPSPGAQPVPSAPSAPPVAPGLMPPPPAPGPMPCPPPPAFLALSPGGIRHHACCRAAITAMVAEVGATADAAIVALTALAHQHRHYGGRGKGNTAT